MQCVHGWQLFVTGERDSMYRLLSRQLLSNSEYILYCLRCRQLCRLECSGLQNLRSGKLLRVPVCSILYRMPCRQLFLSAKLDFMCRVRSRQLLRLYWSNRVR